jgi:hypothetical protein
VGHPDRASGRPRFGPVRPRPPGTPRPTGPNCGWGAQPGPMTANDIYQVITRRGRQAVWTCGCIGSGTTSVTPGWIAAARGRPNGTQRMVLPADALLQQHQCLQHRRNSGLSAARSARRLLGFCLTQSIPGEITSGRLAGLRAQPVQADPRTPSAVAAGLAAKVKFRDAYGAEGICEWLGSIIRHTSKCMAGWASAATRFSFGW